MHCTYFLKALCIAYLCCNSAVKSQLKLAIRVAMWLM